MFRNDRHNHKCGGVCIYVRNDISEIIWSTQHSNPLVEIVALKCLYRHYTTYFLICCYYPPKAVYSAGQLSDEIAGVFDSIFKYDKGDVFVV
jgi:hypothetical protein